MQFKDMIQFEDNHLLVINKPGGLLAQGDQTGDDSLLELGKKYLIEEYNKSGNAFLGLVHRLDRPVSGLLVYAKTSKAASRLSEQFRKKTTVKIYQALVQGNPPAEGQFKHWLLKKGSTSFAVSPKEGKQAELSWNKLKQYKAHSLVEITLKTGRHHQIRVQFSTEGFPLLGDFRYGSKIKFPNQTIALHACRLSFMHPTLKTEMNFTVNPPEEWKTFI
jgi:23S rRNA pseudouridine1911/1915/1917 synthase